jgi:hypothetical protein
MRLDGPKGLCVHRSAALCYDLPGSQLVFGTFTAATSEQREAMPEASDCAFIHAWVEYKGRVYAPTTIEHFGGLVGMDKVGYYKVNGAHNMRRMTRRHLVALFRLTPELLEQLQFGIMPARHGLLVDTLLKAAKVSYRVSADGGLVPMELSE